MSSLPSSPVGAQDTQQLESQRSSSSSSSICYGLSSLLSVAFAVIDCVKQNEDEATSTTLCMLCDWESWFYNLKACGVASNVESTRNVGKLLIHDGLDYLEGTSEIKYIYREKCHTV